MNKVKFSLFLLIIFLIPFMMYGHIQEGQVKTKTWYIGYPDSTKVEAVLLSKTLIIRGEGQMMNYPAYRHWGSFHPQITKIEIQKGVTNIGNHAFKDCVNLISVALPDGLDEIGEFAFDGCQSLISVTLPESITNIKRNAFSKCSNLSSITIPSKVKKIGEYAFYECRKLTSVSLGDSVQTIGNCAFRDCPLLKSITIPADVSAIGSIAFRECSSMKNIHVDTANLVYKSIDGVLYNKNSDSLITFPNGRTGTFVIPSFVKKIGGSAFSTCKGLASIVIPDGVEIIGVDAFRYCYGLTNVVIPPSVTDIEVLAFGNCTNLKSVAIGSGVAKISEYAFSQCESLTNFNVHSTNSNYCSEDGVIYNKNKDTLTCFPCGRQGSFVIPNGVKYIATRAFSSSSLKSITIPACVENFGDMAFSYCHSLLIVINQRAEPQSISTNEIFSSSSFNKVRLYIPVSSLSLYRNAEGWKNFDAISTIE